MRYDFSEFFRIPIGNISWASYQIGKIVGAHGSGMPGAFSPSPWVSGPDMHHGTCVTHVSWLMPGSLTSGFLWSRRRGKRSRHSRRMRNQQQFYVSGKRPIGLLKISVVAVSLKITNSFYSRIRGKRVKLLSVKLRLVFCIGSSYHPISWYVISKL